MAEPVDTLQPPSWQEIAEAMAVQRDQASRSYERERDRADSLVAKLARVRAIHVPNTRFPHYCANCRGPWPCKTFRAIEPIPDDPVEVADAGP